MTSRSWCKVILLLVTLVGLLHSAKVKCRHQSQRCDECYDTLADSLVNMHNNKYNLRRVFYPLERESPVFVTVTYQYDDSSVPNQMWYWSAGVFYYLQPLEVFQFTSLFFGNPNWRSNNITLILPAECASASEEFMTELTEQLKLFASQLTHKPSIDNTYKARAFNLITLNSTLYTDVTFYGADHPKLLYCFQFLFPPLVIILVVMYSFCWLVKKCDQNNQDANWAVDPDSWAITIAHAIISSTFIVYVIALDIAAVIFRDLTPEYHNESYNRLLFYYPGFLLFWDLIAAIIIATLIIITLVLHYCANRAATVSGDAEIEAGGENTAATVSGDAEIEAHGKNRAATREAKCCDAIAMRRPTNGDKNTFLLLKLTGVVPLLVLASHAHYILIAWITDPFYATGIKINYVIFYVIHLLVLKQSCKSYDLLIKCKSADPGTGCKALFGCIAVLAVFAVWLVSLSLQVLVTAFFVYIPINYSIEDTPSKLLTIIQGVVVLIVGLIAWKVIIDPRGKEPLAIISGALRKVIEKKDSTCEIDIDEWVRFDDEEKLAQVLHDVIKIQENIIQQQVNTIQQQVNTTIQQQVNTIQQQVNTIQRRHTV